MNQNSKDNCKVCDVWKKTDVSLPEVEGSGPLLGRRFLDEDPEVWQTNEAPILICRSSHVLCYRTMGNYVAVGIRMANLLTLGWKDHPGFLGAGVPSNLKHA